MASDSRMPSKVWIGAMLAIAFVALGVLAFGNLGDNLVYYWNPTELIAAGDKAKGATIRLGGQVQKGSVKFDNSSTELAFTVEDGENSVVVEGNGMPPQMFREGIGVVVEGTMKPDGTFECDQVMVKHSNEYKAPEEGVDSKELYKTLEEEF